MKFLPLHDRVVVRQIEEDMKTAGGIIIPDTAKEKPMQGEVIAIGPGLQLGDGGTTGSILGNVVNQGTLALNRSNTYVFDGIISGPGMVVQAGTGTTIFTGANICVGRW